VAYVINGAALEIEDGALLNHAAYASGTAIVVSSGTLSIARSVFTNNDTTSPYGGAAVSVSGTPSAPAAITVEDSVFAMNVQPGFGGSTRKNITTSGTVTKVNKGRNLYDDATGGFFDTTPGVGDYLGSVDYVVTSVADTFDHPDDLEALSLREAVDLANATPGTQEIWIPAWNFTLTRDRQAYGGGSLTDTNVAFSDLDLSDSAIIRGVAGRTSVAWKSGVVDKVFDLLGDYNNDGQADYGSVSAADYTIWQDQNGSSGAWEQFSADADDDGDVDQDDYDVWQQNFGHSMQLLDVAVV
jgi:hypothetical protein